MSPDVVAVDEFPDADPDELGGEVTPGMSPCPECGEYFKSRGLSRHRNSAHGVEPERKQSTGSSNKTPAFALQWAEFQRGAALFVSFACSACAAVLMEDAVTDGEAIARYCENKPKLRKQIQGALGSMEIMALVGALGGTAQKMVAHHDIGKKLGMKSAHTHEPVQGGVQEKMMGFLTSMPEDARNKLLNDVFTAHGAATAASSSVAAQAPATVTVAVVHDDEPVPGMPTVDPDTTQLTEKDRELVAAMHGGTDFMDTL